MNKYKKFKFVLSIIMFKSLSLALLLSLSLLFYSGNSFGQEWSYLGFSKNTGDSIFYIFALAENGNIPGELLITQKHVLNAPQKLSNERSYNSILISRTLNCNDKTISVDKAVFSNGIGSTVGTYENKNSSKVFEKIDNSKEIDLFLLGKYCKG